MTVVHGQQIRDRVFCIASLKQGPVISQTGEERGWGHPVTPLQYAVCDLRGACWKHGFQQFWGLDGWHAPTTALLRGISGYNIVKVGDEGGSLAGNMSLLLLKEGSSKQYAFCTFFFFFKSSSDLLLFFFLFISLSDEFLSQMHVLHMYSPLIWVSFQSWPLHHPLSASTLGVAGREMQSLMGLQPVPWKAAQRKIIVLAESSYSMWSH